MKCAVVEPLGVSKEVLLECAAKILGSEIEIDYYPDRKEDEQSLISRSGDADIVMISNIPYNREIMSKNPNLKMVCDAFTGYDHIDMEYCREHDITVCNCSGYATTAVVELVFGSLIGLYRRIPQCDQAVRGSKTKDGLIGFELEGKTFGIVGLGAIGRAVAKVALAFGCHVITYSVGSSPMEGVEEVGFEELLQRSDIVSLHVPLMESTKGLINRAALEQMKKTAVLVNAARGPVVDNAALAQALNEGLIAGAALDVFDMEPPVPQHDPLLKAPNTLLTPHVAFATSESMVKRVEIAFDNVKRWIDGNPKNVVS